MRTTCVLSTSLMNLLATLILAFVLEDAAFAACVAGVRAHRLPGVADSQVLWGLFFRGGATALSPRGRAYRLGAIAAYVLAVVTFVAIAAIGEGGRQ